MFHVFKVLVLKSAFSAQRESVAQPIKNVSSGTDNVALLQGFYFCFERLNFFLLRAVSDTAFVCQYTPESCPYCEDR